MSSEDVAADIGQNQAEVQEKMLPQSEVDRIVGARVARERAQLESQYRQQSQTQGMGGMQSPGYDEEALLTKATERMQRQWEEQRENQQLEMQKQQVEEVARQYNEKMKQGPELYPDFQEVTGDYNPAAFPQVTILAAQMDNLPDIMYELNKNPTKLTHIHSLALANPEMARKEMHKLSQSIKRNEEALNNSVKSPSPLTKLKSSTVAGSDTGKRSISDLRKQSWLRG